jgi:Rab-GTPase-TBC domain
MFQYQLPREVVLRVWDLFFLEGYRVAFCIALAVLNIEWPRLRHLEFEGVRKPCLLSSPRHTRCAACSCAAGSPWCRWPPGVFVLIFSPAYVFVVVLLSSLFPRQLMEHVRLLENSVMISPDRVVKLARRYLRRISENDLTELRIRFPAQAR